LTLGILEKEYYKISKFLERRRTLFMLEGHMDKLYVQIILMLFWLVEDAVLESAAAAQIKED